MFSFSKRKKKKHGRFVERGKNKKKNKRKKNAQMLIRCVVFSELYEHEKGVSVRQVLSVLAKLLQTEPTIANMLVEKEKRSEAR